MTDQPVSASRSAILAIAASVVAFASLFGLFANADNALQSDFREALAAQNSGLRADVSVGAVGGRIVQVNSVAASEDFWLRYGGRALNTVPVAFTSAIEIGDTVTISTKSGKRVLQVESLTTLPTVELGGNSNSGAPDTYVLTAREAGRANGFVMRLLVENGRGQVLRGDRSASDRNL